MQRILIIEEQTNISNQLAASLRLAGYSCVQAFSGTEGIFYADREPFSLIILEEMLSGMGSKEVLSRLENRRKRPVLMISTRNESDSRFHLLDGKGEGAPNALQMTALVAQVGRQLQPDPSEEKNANQNLRYKELVLDTASYLATVNDTALPLTLQEFKILELLISHPDRTFSKREIYDYAWDDPYAGEDKTINVHISNIRKKLKTVTDQEYIQTIWGTGFRLNS